MRPAAASADCSAPPSATRTTIPCTRRVSSSGSPSVTLAGWPSSRSNAIVVAEIVKRSTVSSKSCETVSVKVSPASPNVSGPSGVVMETRRFACEKERGMRFHR